MVIGSRWLDPRLNQEQDVLRKEIATLLRLKKAVLPLLIDGASLPESDKLPKEQKDLRKYQARVLDNASWDISVNELIRIIDRHLAKTRPMK